VAAVAGGVRLPALRLRQVEDGQGRLVVCGLSPSGVGDLRHDLRAHPHAVDDVVCGWLVHDQPEDRGGVGQGLQRVLELGSYQTAWTILHKYRSAMVRPGRDLLPGIVEVDKTLVGGTKPGAAGRGALGKTLVAVAVEVHDPRGFGRARLQVIPDASKPTLSGFVTDTIESGATVRTDGWLSYRGLESLGYTRATPTIRSTCPLPVNRRTCPCRGSTGSRRCSNGRCSTPTSSTPSCTCRRTATSGCSASTVATPGLAGCCSSG
jgi:hypothetical protein